MGFFMLKTEPRVFSWDHLKAAKEQTTQWEGVRNYQARNYIRSMKKGDLCLFYHSNVKPNIIPGIVKVVSEPYPDPFAFDPNSRYFEPKGNLQKPRWFCVDVKKNKEFKTPITREELKQIPALADLELLRRGSRLSVHPLTEQQFKIIVSLRS